MYDLLLIFKFNSEIMKYILYLLIICNTSIDCVFANDGAFFSEGINIYPFKDTKIELKKEILNLTIKDGFMYVNVYFEFYNPKKVDIKQLVGFVSRPPGGDAYTVRDNEIIQNFKVELNSKQLKYKIYRVGDLDTNNINGDLDSRDIAYTFNVKFKPGINVIKHSYKSMGGDLLGNREYYYVLETGKNWANKQIDDFTLNINIDTNLFVAFPASFEKGKLINWNIVGEYQILQDYAYFKDSYIKEELEYNKNFYDFGIKLIQMNKTTLTFKENNFKPDNDIKITTNRPENPSLDDFLLFLDGYNFKIDTTKFK